MIPRQFSWLFQLGLGLSSLLYSWSGYARERVMLGLMILRYFKFFETKTYTSGKREYKVLSWTQSLPDQSINLYPASLVSKQ